MKIARTLTSPSVNHLIYKPIQWAMLTLILCWGSMSQQALSNSETLQVPTRIAAASSFRAVWPSLADQFAQTGAVPPSVSFASSGLLATQIRHGAPFDLFITADAKSIEVLETAGKTQGESATIAYGSLALVASQKLAQPLTLQSMDEALRKNSRMKIAIPNPRHAPYGQAAQQALTNAEFWPLPDGQILSAENASQALHYALQGVANFAMVPFSLVAKSAGGLVVRKLSFSNYHPIEHQLVQIDSAATGNEFYSWMQSDEAKSILLEHGLDISLP